MGTKKHSKLYDGIDSLNVMGCFCLTELGYGNNAIEMETTATWDNQKKVFILNTPTINSQKYWITNGAYHANHSVVFAQVIVNGKQEGLSIWYSEKAVVLKEFLYENDELHGLSKYYDSNGQLIAEGVYKRGQKHGVWKYYTDGKLTEEKNFSLKYNPNKID